MAQTWYTSDLHLGHPFVAGLRGFNDVEEHDRVILHNLSQALSPGDTLWVLGDISSGWAPQEQRALRLLKELFTPLRHTGDAAEPVRFHLISGNHDSSHPLHEHSSESQADFLDVFDSVQSFQYAIWEGQDYWMCHFPRPGYDHEGMVSRHDPLRLDVPHLVHGHLHSIEPVTGPGQVDVGVDAWDLSPVRRKDVMNLVFR